MTYQITDPASGSTFLSTGAQATQTTVEMQNVTGSNQQNASLSLSASNWVGYRFNSGAGATSETWATATASLSALSNSGDTGALIYVEIWSDSAGLPGAKLVSVPSQVLTGTWIAAVGAPVEVPMSWSPANSTYYWLVVRMSGAMSGTYTILYDNSTGSGLVARSTNAGSTWGAIAGTGYFALGQGTGHSVVASTITGHAVDATSTNGIAVYGYGSGPGSYSGYFKQGPGGSGFLIDAFGDPENDNNNWPFEVNTSHGNFFVTGDGGGVMQYLVTTATNVSSNTTLSNYGIYTVSASNATLTLPSLSSVNMIGRRFTIKNKSGVTGTIVTAAGGANVEGGASDSTSLASSLAYATYALDSSGANWWRIG